MGLQLNLCAPLFPRWPCLYWSSCAFHQMSTLGCAGRRINPSTPCLVYRRDTMHSRFCPRQHGDKRRIDRHYFQHRFWSILTLLCQQRASCRKSHKGNT
ncbi:hypothetical protein BDW62DRAFT_183095 [Aspergillus aurantiobrunneus]